MRKRQPKPTKLEIACDAIGWMIVLGVPTFYYLVN